tara:strand:- start:184 stop:1929 length:1746 start_codon:yes stop_codon:yes gene_type:complete
MILKSFKIFLGLLVILLFNLPLQSEDKIDIWKNEDKKEKSSENKNLIEQKNNDKINLKKSQKIKIDPKIEIEDAFSSDEKDQQIFGVYDPADNNFNLNMWSTTSADDVKSSLKRLKEIKLSKTSNDILEKILLSFSYPPEGMTTNEFAEIKINWLIDNNRQELIENFLKSNEEFEGKSKAIQYLVDKNIAKANIKEGCEKIKFIDSNLKDAYLEKFKIYCLVFNNKNSQARLLLDLLREQKKSDKFFDDKINFLLGISEKTSTKINEKNLLNFYLSSITIKNFKYEPTKKTKKEIWQYLNSANLIKIDDISDKNKIKDLELAANIGQINEELIFDIYKQIPFNLNTLINAKSLYQTLDNSDSRSLIFQKYLLSEDVESKVYYLFLLDELFKKDNLKNIYVNYLSNQLKAIGLENIPENYQEIAQKKIILNEQDLSLGKIKYNDKILHQSKIIKFYVDKETQKKTQKDIDKILKKISKNKKYFFSAKDLALVDSLAKDGFEIPNLSNYKDLASKFGVPKNLLQLIEKNQNAFLALKIVEIIGEDEPYQLDPETIYFITNLLNEMNLIKIRNKVIISALPQRV